MSKYGTLIDNALHSCNGTSPAPRATALAQAGILSQALGKTRAEIDAFLDAIPQEA